MKPKFVLKLYGLILLIIFGGIVVHAPLSVWLGSFAPSYSLVIKAWKEILMVVAAGLGVYLVIRNKAWNDLAKDRIVQVLILYLALHIMVASALLSGPEATLAGMMIDLRYVVFFMLVYILMKLAPEYRQRILRIAGAGAAVVVGFAVMQIFLPADILKHIGYSENTIQPYLTVDKNHDYIRINSTLRGPNPLGAYVVIVLGFLTAFMIKTNLKLQQKSKQVLFVSLVIGSLIALWLSYSRSALGAAALAIFLSVVIPARNLISRRVWIAGSVILFAMIGGLFAARDTPLVTNVILHENRVDGSATTSNEGHVSSLVDGTERMLRQPAGAGIGSTGSASLMTSDPLIIENQYLFIAHEVGWLGLGLFVALFGLILERLWHRRDDWLALGVLTSGVGLACIGLLLPVWADDTVSIIWWGLAAVAIVEGGRGGRKQSQQKTA